MARHVMARWGELALPSPPTLPQGLSSSSDFRKEGTRFLDASLFNKFYLIQIHKL
jgi:hypothetical protein